MAFRKTTDLWNMVLDYEKRDGPGFEAECGKLMRNLKKLDD
jgi:hypothetical protein